MKITGKGKAASLQAWSGPEGCRKLRFPYFMTTAQYCGKIVYVFLDAATLTEVSPCFFFGCKANARVILAKTGHGPHSSKIVV